LHPPINQSQPINQAEVNADATRGTGCSYDGELVWTSSTCEDEDGVESGKRTLMGYNAANGKGTCRDTSPESAATAMVRCVADQVPQGQPEVDNTGAAGVDLSICEDSSRQKFYWQQATGQLINPVADLCLTAIETPGGDKSFGLSACANANADHADADAAADAAAALRAQRWDFPLPGLHVVEKGETVPLSLTYLVGASTGALAVQMTGFDTAGAAKGLRVKSARSCTWADPCVYFPGRTAQNECGLRRKPVQCLDEPSLYCHCGTLTFGGGDPSIFSPTHAPKEVSQRSHTSITRKRTHTTTTITHTHTHIRTNSHEDHTHHMPTTHCRTGKRSPSRATLTS
jgi:hypothetical protein